MACAYGIFSGSLPDTLQLTHTVKAPGFTHSLSLLQLKAQNTIVFMKVHLAQWSWCCSGNFTSDLGERIIRKMLALRLEITGRYEL